MAKKNPAAVALGRRGGKARWAKSSKSERVEFARKMINARWHPKKPRTPDTPPARATSRSRTS